MLRWDDRARTGRERTAIVGYIADGPNIVTLAMNGWAERSRPGGSTSRHIPTPQVDLVDGPREVQGTRRGGRRARAPLVAVRSAACGATVSDTFAARRSRETAVVVFEPRD